jgi:hypothetical protein
MGVESNRQENGVRSLCDIYVTNDFIILPT